MTEPIYDDQEASYMRTATDQEGHLAYPDVPRWPVPVVQDDQENLVVTETENNHYDN